MTDERTILLVDDNDDFVELTRRAFSKSNIVNPLVVAKDGTEALDYFFAEGGELRERPVLILLDLKLPKVGGLEVLRRLRENPRTKNIPVVILTTSSEEQDLIRGYDLGCNSYIRKPVDFIQLNEVMRQLGVYWLMVNESPVLPGGKQ
jgi:CheY-like chemotaxis protein